ncbi:MAG: 7-cyano-7-deazaguanine synthase QueC [Candidatus Jordarchaeum sp.]|uniref:7-cyano-7-deazaguanine synthase QueC n=1 Tax=Candidatus Jordarchaeum sp. TaxID=2823881 RepID=UPI00404A8888
MKIGIVLLSGGLDSTTTAAYAKSLGYEVHAITVHYGQKLSREIKSAKKVAKILGLKHKILDISPFKEMGWYSALTHPELFAVPKDRSVEEMMGDVPITYVPLRNTFLIVLAAAYLESEVLHRIERLGMDPEEIEARIFIAANVLDYSGYPDCRPEFYQKINELMRVATKAGSKYNVEMRVETPLIYRNKREIVELGTELEAPLEWTWSCYEGDEVPCGKCDSCLLRAKGFKEAGIRDPLLERLKRRANCEN